MCFSFALVGCELFTLTRVYSIICSVSVVSEFIRRGNKPNEIEIAKIEAELKNGNNVTNQQIAQKIQTIFEACWKFSPRERPTMRKGLCCGLQ